MKKLETILILLFVTSLMVFNSCKKDPKDLENSYMDIIIDSDNGLSVIENNLRYVANLSPNTLSGEKVNINYSSQADPVGYTIESGYANTILDWGNDEYNIQRIDRSFDAAAFTNADKGFLKVNPAGDKITIKIGDNAFTETVDFKRKYNKAIVISTSISGQGYLMGEIKYYNEEELRPEIKMYSTSHPDEITTTPHSEYGDNGYRASDPSVSEAFGYSIYTINLVYDEASSNATGNNVLVNNDSDTIFVIIDGETYSVTYQGEKLYKELMTPVN